MKGKSAAATALDVNCPTVHVKLYRRMLIQQFKKYLLMKKKTTNKLIIDLNHIDNVENIYKAFALAKFKTYFTESQQELLRQYFISQFFDGLNSYYANCVEDEYSVEAEQENKKKPNIFKRFWNWVTRNR